MQEKELLEAILNGTIRIRRFTQAEQAGCSQSADRLLWLSILRAERELVELDAGEDCGGSSGEAESSFRPSRFLSSLGPVRPTANQIRDAIYALKLGFIELTDEAVEEDGSSPSSDEDTGEHLRFYNSDYYISDLQPGRNTVIDAKTGLVRFIDPRIVLNDPEGPITHASKFGSRHEQQPGQRL